MKTIRNLLVLSGVVMALAATGCGGEDCHQYIDENGAMASICGCQDSVDENGNTTTYCSTGQIASTQEAVKVSIAVVCGVGRNMVVNPDECECYYVTPVGLVPIDSDFWECLGKVD